MDNRTGNDITKPKVTSSNNGKQVLDNSPKRLSINQMINFHISTFVLIFWLQYSNQIFLIRLLTGVPIGSNKNTLRNQTPIEINKTSMKPPKPPPPQQKQQQELQNVNSNNLLSLGKGMAQPDVPFMKSVLPVTSLFSSIKSGVQTSVTAAVKAGKQYLSQELTHCAKNKWKLIYICLLDNLLLWY